MKEEWKDIKGHKGYQVSNSGRVRSYRNSHNGLKDKPKILKQTISIHGYPYISLVKSGKSKKYVVHRLVCSAFKDNPEGKKFVNHKDGDKQNNNSLNLEWCTRSENEKHAYANGLKFSSVLHKKRARDANRGENNHRSKLTKKSVKSIKSLMSDDDLTQRQIAKKFGVSYSTITAIKKGRAWAHVN